MRIRLGFLLLVLGLASLCLAERSVKYTECSPSVSLPNIYSLKVDTKSDLPESWTGATLIKDVTYNTNLRVEDGQDNTTFERPLPFSLDPSFLETFERFFNKEQKVSTRCAGAGCNTFSASGPFVALLNDAFVDFDGNVFDKHNAHVARREIGSIKNSMPLWLPERVEVRCYSKLVTILQPYEDSYYQFVEEALPRLLLAREAMRKDPELKLLTRMNAPFITEFLVRLRIPLDRVISASLSKDIVYHAKEVYVPRPTPLFAPSKDALLAVREAILSVPKGHHGKHGNMFANYVSQLSIEAASSSPLVIYVSRKNEPARDVVNEQQIVEAIERYLTTYNQDKAESQKLKVVTFNGDLSVEQTVALFKRARVIIGPHGGGLANMLWANRPATVIEFLNSFDPLMIYWHTAAALDLEYWMLPVPESYYGGHFLVPQDEVVEILHRALTKKTVSRNRREVKNEQALIVTPGSELLQEQQQPQQQPILSGLTTGSRICPDGTALSSTSFLCEACPPGTYSIWAGMLTTCAPCAPGRYNPNFGSTFCQTCPANTFTAGQGAPGCLPCTGGSFSVFLGATSSDACIVSTNGMMMQNNNNNAATLSSTNEVVAQNHMAARSSWPRELTARQSVDLGDFDLDVGNPSVSLGDLSANAGNPSVSLGGLSANAGNPSASVGGTSVSAGRPSASIGGTSVSAGRPSASFGGASVSAGTNTATLGGASVSTGTNTATIGGTSVSAGTNTATIGGATVTTGGRPVVTAAPTIWNRPALSVARPALAPQFAVNQAPSVAATTTQQQQTQQQAPTAAAAGANNLQQTQLTGTAVPGQPISVTTTLSVGNNNNNQGSQLMAPRPVPPMIPPLSSIPTIPTPAPTPTPVASAIEEFGSEVFGSEVFGSEVAALPSLQTLLASEVGSAVANAFGSIFIPITLTVQTPLGTLQTSVSSDTTIPSITITPSLAAEPSPTFVQTTAPATTTLETAAPGFVYTGLPGAYIPQNAASSPAARSEWFLSSVVKTLF